MIRGRVMGIQTDGTMHVKVADKVDESLLEWMGLEVEVMAKEKNLRLRRIEEKIDRLMLKAGIKE